MMKLICYSWNFRDEILPPRSLILNIGFNPSFLFIHSLELEESYQESFLYDFYMVDFCKNKTFPINYFYIWDLIMFTFSLLYIKINKINCECASDF